MIRLIFNRNQLDDEDEIKEFSVKYSTFFEEFKQTGTSVWIFYLLYIIRRFIIVFAINFIQDGVLQLAISFVCSLCVIYYIDDCLCIFNKKL